MIPYFMVVGFQGAGKTAWAQALIGEARRRGLEVLAIKHHPVPHSPAGKDTARLGRAGAGETVLAEGGRLLWERERPWEVDELRSLAEGRADLLLLEGFKGERGPKLWIGPASGPLPEGVVATAGVRLPGVPFYTADEAGVCEALTHLLSQARWRSRV